MDAPKAEAKVLTLIDASNFIFRAYHAIPHLSTSKGVSTNAVYGFTRMVLKTLRELSPTHVALAFDKESRKGRLAIDPQYKATRLAPPPDLIPQFELIRAVVAALKIPVLEVAGWEADDVIGTLACRAKREGFQVLVVTGDKDFLQIVDEDVQVYDPMLDRRYDAAAVRAKLGVSPSQVRDYLALVGDAIDNVPKVPGVGPKTAAELLATFGDVETLLGRLDEVKKPRIRQALESHQESLLRSKQLVSFKLDLPVDVPIAELARRPIDEAQARELFSELEFFKLLAEMPQVAPTPLPVQTCVLEAAELAGWAAHARAAGAIALAAAYEGPAHQGRWVGLGMAVEGVGTAYLPVGHRVLDAAPRCSPEQARAVLAPLLDDPGVRVVGHDLKALVLLLGAHRIPVRRPEGDVQLLSYLLNPGRREHALPDLARERLRLELPALPGGPHGRKAASPSEITAAEAAPCYGAHAEAARRLESDLWPELERVGLAELARTLELPLLPVLARMEQAGIRVDLEVLRTISVEVDGQCKARIEQLHAHAGHPFNVNSNAQLAAVLYEELGLPVQKRGKTGPSTDQEVLEKLAELHPLPRTLLEYRAISKLKSTYLDTLPLLLGPDGRVHTTFHQVQAATGRLSSSDPNLQNIPIRSELGRKIRGAFVAERGGLLISADYSQIELRLLAHISEDPQLLEAFRNDADVHARTAAEVFSVPEAEVTPAQRRAAKAVNFGIAYGLSPYGLSTRLGITGEEAKAIIDRYFERYAGIRRYLDETLERARRLGFVETLFGRRRYIPELSSRNRAAAQAAERAAINMPIQGTAADLIKMAMLRLDRELPARGLSARMLLQVHDELLLEAPAAELGAASEVVVACMSEVATLRVPLRVDVGHGFSWAEAH